MNFLSILIPQAQNPIFIESNMMIAKICIVVALTYCCSMVFPKIAFVLPIGILLFEPSSNMKDGLEYTTVGRSATAWIKENTPVHTTFTSTFENAPIIWLAERNWQQWKDPWSPEKHPEYVLSNNWEVFLTALPLCPTQKIEAFFEQKGNWIGIYSCRD